MGKRHVLITGGAGRVASILRQHWGTRYRLRLADVRPVVDLDRHEEYVELDITDLGSFTVACEGIDTILHLAADPSPQADFYQSLLSLNIIGGYNGFEAARRAGCRRLVFASSINALLGYGRKDGQPDGRCQSTRRMSTALPSAGGKPWLVSTATSMLCRAFACVCTARPSTRVISPKTPRMVASARGMRPICSLPASMPMTRSASLSSTVLHATKMAGSWSVRRIRAWPTSHRTARRSLGRNAGYTLALVKCRKSGSCPGPHRTTRSVAAQSARAI